MTTLIQFEARCKGLLCRVPEGAFNFEIWSDVFWWDMKDKNDWGCVELPPGQWVIEGNTKGLSEEVMEMVIGAQTYNDRFYRYAKPGVLRPQSFEATFTCNTLKDSFESWLTSLGATDGDWILLTDKK